MAIKDWKKVKGYAFTFRKYYIKKGTQGRTDELEYKEIGAYSEGKYGEHWVELEKSTGIGSKTLKNTKTYAEAKKYVKSYMRKH